MAGREQKAFPLAKTQWYRIGCSTFGLPRHCGTGLDYSSLLSTPGDETGQSPSLGSLSAEEISCV